MVQPPKRRPSAQDLANCDQLGQLPIELSQLTWPDGSPMELLLRARSAEDRAKCDRAATRAAIQLDMGSTCDENTYAIMTVFYGLAEPKLTEAQLPILWSLNTNIIDELADGIERLEKLPAAALRARLERMANTPIPAAESASTKKRRATSAAELDRGAGKKTESVSE